MICRICEWARERQERRECACRSVMVEIRSVERFLCWESMRRGAMREDRIGVRGWADDDDLLWEHYLEPGTSILTEGLNFRQKKTRSNMLSPPRATGSDSGEIFDGASWTGYTVGIRVFEGIQRYDNPNEHLSMMHNALESVRPPVIPNFPK